MFGINLPFKQDIKSRKGFTGILPPCTARVSRPGITLGVRYIDTHRSDPSGSQLKSFCLPMGESVQFCASFPRAISVAPVALVYRKVHALTSGTSNSTYSGSIMATWVF